MCEFHESPRTPLSLNPDPLTRAQQAATWALVCPGAQIGGARPLMRGSVSSLASMAGISNPVTQSTVDRHHCWIRTRHPVATSATPSAAISPFVPPSAFHSFTLSPLRSCSSPLLCFVSHGHHSPRTRTRSISHLCSPTREKQRPLCS
jgi:hypothetical protein